MEFSGRNQVFEAMVDQFLDELQRETGVSSVFLRSARPAVERMFAEIPEDQRAVARERVLLATREHARTEAHLTDVLSHLTRLNGQTVVSPGHHGDTLQRIAFTKAMVVHTLLRTWGGFGENRSVSA